MEYADFLNTKRIESVASGFAVDSSDLNSMLFPFQRDIDIWSLKRGHAAIFSACGTGKTPMELTWADAVVRESDEPCLIVAPLAVSHQTIREAEKFGFEASIALSDDDIKRPTTYVTNYEKLINFPRCKLGGVVLDECFPPDTPVDVFNLDMVLESRYISQVRAGDFILNASGVDQIEDTCKRRIDRAIQISVNGRRVTCSENHPFFTMHGWRSAKDLQARDRLMATEKAMRLVRDDLSAQVDRTENGPFLRSVLLSEVAYEYAGAFSQSTQLRSGSEAGPEPIPMATLGQSEGEGPSRAYPAIKPDAESVYAAKGFSSLARHESQAASAGRQRKATACTAANPARFAGGPLDSRVGDLSREETRRLSDLLQSGLGQPGIENSYRGRREFALPSESFGREEGREVEFFRVDSVEVLERGHPELEKYRDADGHVYFYDLKAKRHPSFSVHGMLVHNSSRLKDHTSATRNAVIQRFQNVPMRLACTATPAPNDFMELANHSEFLGALTRSEMLSTFFVHDGGDTSKWRLKGHAENEFWKWVCSWAVMLQMPSDLGYDDGDFVLPKLHMHEHIVKNDKPLDGYLFQQEARTLNERRQARRSSLNMRAKLCAEIVNAKPTESWVIWCDLNDEGDLMEKLIPDAVQIAGRHSDDEKESRMLGFINGSIRVLVSKPSICGHGMNLQHCTNMVFLGLSDSWERFYQAVRRFWRFGQLREVNCHLVISEAEGAVLRNIQRKENDAARMAKEMVKHMSVYNQAALREVRATVDYNPSLAIKIPSWLRTEAA